MLDDCGQVLVNVLLVAPSNKSVSMSGLRASACQKQATRERFARAPALRASAFSLVIGDRPSELVEPGLHVGCTQVAQFTLDYRHVMGLLGSGIPVLTYVFIREKGST